MTERPSGITPSQTVGPYFSIGLPWPDGPHVVEPGTEGAIVLRGHVVDGEGVPVPGALPPGELLLSSAPVGDDRVLPADATAWLRDPA